MSLFLIRNMLNRSVQPVRPWRRRNRRATIQFEYLEDRLLLAITSVDFQGLRFIDTAGFTKDAVDNEWVASSGFVVIGFTPAAQETFQKLIQADVTGTNTGNFTINLDD